MYKKKSLKFTYEKFSRDSRHAEALKARESSRFKRLSMIRCLNDSDVESSMETVKLNENKKQDQIASNNNSLKPALAPEKKKPPSRLEMLFKWKREKELKKEMENKNKKKPFYVGANTKNIADNKPLQNLKSSFTAQSNSTFNSSKFVKSKLFGPSNPIQKNNALNAKQGTPIKTSQLSRLQNSKQGTPIKTSQPSRIQKSKQEVPTAASQTLRVPSSKQAGPVPKSTNTLSKNNSTAAFLKKFPNAVPVSSSLSRSNSTASLTKRLPNSLSNSASNLNKANSVTKNSYANKTNNVSNSRNITKPKDLLKPVNKGLPESKSVPKCQEKVVAKSGTGLPKLKSYTASARKETTPVQCKLPVSSLNKKVGSIPKAQQKEAPQPKENMLPRKGYCFRKAIAEASNRQIDMSPKIPIYASPKVPPKKPGKDVEKKLSEETSEQDLDCIPNVTFNADISIINPVSFAPDNFKFQPPEGLNNFVFDDDDDDDPYKALEQIKLKFMSRTSTPSKNSSTKSSIKSFKESLENDNPTSDINMSLEEKIEVSNSIDLHISELMTPGSFDERTDEKIFEVVNQQDCKKTAFDTVINVETEETDVGLFANEDVLKSSSNYIKICTNVEESVINQQASEDIISNISNNTGTDKSVAPQQACEEPTDVYINTGASEPVTQQQIYDKADSNVSLISEAHNSVFQNSCEEIISNTNKDLILEDATNEKVENDLLKSPFKGSQFSSDSNTNENSKMPSLIEKLSNGNEVENSSEDRTTEDMLEKNYLDADDSLLDSIDLNKIQLVTSDDEDTDDDVPSPQTLKNLGRKSGGAIPKRVSMLRKLSIMNSIAESFEADECVTRKSSVDNPDANNSPRRSKRLSSRSMNILNDSNVKTDSPQTSVTPRRSLRLKKENIILSPFDKKKTSHVTTRQSMKLIDLNTPVKDGAERSKSNLPLNSVRIEENSENLDPNNFMIDLDSPTLPSQLKNKKVSLLYSPEKRKSIRRSIRGDLIMFSPS